MSDYVSSAIAEVNATKCWNWMNKTSQALAPGWMILLPVLDLPIDSKELQLLKQQQMEYLQLTSSPTFCQPV
jgi:hypothetical protein